MMQAEALVSRYVKDPSTIVVLDYLGMFFSVQSISNATLRYTVSIQSNYCDCPDENNKYKHIMGAILVIERYMPELRVSYCSKHKAVQKFKIWNNPTFDKTDPVVLPKVALFRNVDFLTI
jgi:hypothetical protein